MATPTPALEPVSGAADAASTAARRRHTSGILRFVGRHPMVVGFGLLVVATLAMRIHWGRTIENTLAAQYEQYRKDGVLLSINDNAADPLTGPEDAQAQILAAERVNVTVSPAHQNRTFPDYPPFGSAWLAAAEASEQQNAKVFDTLRLLRHTEEVKYRSVLTSPLVLDLPELNQSRAVANTLADGAMYQHVQGQDAEAIERLLDLLNLSRLVREDFFAVSNLVGVGISALACQRAEVMAPGLDLSDPEVRRLTAVLIERLLDVRAETSSFRRSFEDERLLVDDGMRYLSKDVWAMRALAMNEILVAHRTFASYAAAARQSDAPSARALLPTGPVRRTSSRSGRRSADFDLAKIIEAPDYSGWYSILRGRLDRYFTQYYRDLGERRLAAVSLAVQLYRADEHRWPARLDELVPKYLAAVPADPFQSDGRSIGYLLLPKGVPDGGDRPLVYFDEGPDVPGLIDVEPMYGWQTDPLERRPRIDPMRQYRDVSRWTAPQRRADQRIAEEEETERLEREEQERMQKELNPQPGEQ